MSEDTKSAKSSAGSHMFVSLPVRLLRMRQGSLNTGNCAGKLRGLNVCRFLRDLTPSICRNVTDLGLHVTRSL